MQDNKIYRFEEVEFFFSKIAVELNYKINL